MLLRNTGAALSPFNAFLFIQGLETLPLRIERHFSNAAAVAKHLESHSQVKWVNYPGLASSPYHDVAQRTLKGGFGGLVTFGIDGGLEAGRRRSSRASACSRTWRTSATPARWRSTTPPPLTRS